MLEYENSFGVTTVSKDAIAAIAGNAATKSFGVVGMAYKNTADGIVSLLKWDNISKGVEAFSEDNEIIINMHIIITYGINIKSITESITHNVKYSVETATGFKVRKVCVFIDSIKQ
ncbi:MAG: Asp23/Gls24 family envelope stress response protein [Clostridia bacterium]